MIGIGGGEFRTTTLAAAVGPSAIPSVGVTTHVTTSSLLVNEEGRISEVAEATISSFINQANL